MNLNKHLNYKLLFFIVIVVILIIGFKKGVFFSNNENATSPNTETPNEFGLVHHNSQLDEPFIEIEVTKNTTLLFDQSEYPLDKICEQLQNQHPKNIGIKLIPHKQSTLKFYSAVFDTLQLCIGALKNHMAEKMFDKQIDGLSPKEKIQLDKIISFQIVETIPK